MLPDLLCYAVARPGADSHAWHGPLPSLLRNIRQKQFLDRTASTKSQPEPIQETRHDLFHSARKWNPEPAERMTRDQAALQTRIRPSTAPIAKPSAPKRKAQAADDNEMICRGNCYNNSIVEMFFKTIKSEPIWPVAWQSCQEAENTAARSNEGSDNRVTRHSSLGARSPVGFERTARKLRISLVLHRSVRHSRNSPIRRAPLNIGIWTLHAHSGGRCFPFLRTDRLFPIPMP